MQENRLRQLKRLGQSVWVDTLSRQMLRSGALTELIERDGVSGVTSNPSTFAEAVCDSDDYDADIRRLAEEGRTVAEIHEQLLVQDIREAADLLRPTYGATYGQDGFVSLEVSPSLAYDEDGTIETARRLWKEVHRPNLMIKVPGTEEGLGAIRELTADGINVNVTLLFGLQRYQDAAEAYVEGLNRRSQAGKTVSGIASVASFFLSRIDVLADKLFDQMQGHRAVVADAIWGRLGVASAKIAYGISREVFESTTFQRLAAEGASRQKLLWASTGVKREGDPPLKYVEPLIGTATVNTMPLKTLNAYRKSGEPARRIEEDLKGAEEVFHRLAETGVQIREITDQLEREGVRKFQEAQDRVTEHLTHQTELAGSARNRNSH